MVNKRRSAFTVVGVALVTAFLFIVLNGIINLTLQIRDLNRKDTGDYEIVFYEMSSETMEQLINDPRIASAYVGKDYDNLTDTEYPNALHVNVKHPYIMNHVLKEIEKDYGVKGELNDLVSWTYLQSPEGGVYIGVLFVILFAYIFSIIGVGVIKNCIELTNMEQIRDYGNLRCIGATRKEIEKIIFNEGFIVESTGIILGILIGYPLYIIAALNISFYEMFNDPTVKLQTDFHFLPVIIVFLVFMFDLFFTMKSSAKHIAKISPVSAIKGEFRIKKEKYKKRRSGLFGLIFGVEGDYAYKNVMRNKGRFIKSVLAMTLGLAAMTFFGCFVNMLVKITQDSEKYFGYYKYGVAVENRPTYTTEQVKAAMPKAASLKKMSESKEVLEATYSYSARVYSAEEMYLKDKYDTGYKEYYLANYVNRVCETLEESEPLPRFDSLFDIKGDIDTNKKVGTCDIVANELTVKAYEGEDYERLNTRLKDGSISLSPDGILVVGSGYSLGYIDDYSMQYKYMDLFNIKVGDKVEIVDPVELSKRCQEKMANSMRDYEEKISEYNPEKIKEYEEKLAKEEIDPDDPEYKDIPERPIYYGHRNMIISEARHELMEEGKVKTYIVEGILDGDPNSQDEPEFILPLDRYLDLMGYTKEDWNGINYRFKNHIFLDDETNEELMYHMDMAYGESSDNSLPECNTIGYLFVELNMFIKPFAKIILLIAFIIFTVVLINCINIVNTSAANLHMRRKEFAQLKAMGMTDRGLTKAVLLEGVIALIFAALFGITIGMLLMKMMYWALFSEFGLVEGLVSFPWFAIIIGLLLSGTVLIGSLYIPLRNMKRSLQGELTLSGE